MVSPRTAHPAATETPLPMVRPAIVVIAAVAFIARTGPSAAQNEPLLGTWSTVDPGTGTEHRLVVTPRTLRFGEGREPLPYTASREGDAWRIDVGGGVMPSATLQLTGADRGTLSLPGIPPFELTRVSAHASAPGAQGSTRPASPFMPYGVTTRFEPLRQSLEALLAAGWQLDHATSATGGFMLLLSRDGTRALCMLVPDNRGLADTATSDCRRLN